MTEDYYESQEWEEEREWALANWDGLCEYCDEITDSPHVHHKYGLSKQVYEILCPDCHADHHDNSDLRTYRKKKKKWIYEERLVQMSPNISFGIRLPIRVIGGER